MVAFSHRFPSLKKYTSLVKYHSPLHTVEVFRFLQIWLCDVRVLKSMSENDGALAIVYTLFYGLRIVRIRQFEYRVYNVSGCNQYPVDIVFGNWLHSNSNSRLQQYQEKLLYRYISNTWVWSWCIMKTFFGWFSMFSSLVWWSWTVEFIQY